MTPSTECGPYRGKDVMYSVVPELVDSWKSDYPWLTTVINFIASPGFVAAVLVALGYEIFFIHMSNMDICNEFLFSDGGVEMICMFNCVASVAPVAT